MRNEADLLAIIRPAIAARPTAYWTERLRAADVMHERLNTFRDFLEQPQAEAINLFACLPVEGAPESLPIPNIAGLAPFTPGTPRATTPVVGQHTREILREHDFSAAEIDALAKRGVITVAER